MEPGILRHPLAAFKVEKSNEITTHSLVGVRGAASLFWLHILCPTAAAERRGPRDIRITSVIY